MKRFVAFPYSVTMPLLKDVKNQVPEAICEVAPGNVSRNLIVNRDVPPFDNPDLRRAMALSLDRKAFIDIITEGQGNVGGVMQPPPEGLWGMPPEILHALPGYDPDVQKNRTQARQIMQKLGYGPDNRLKIKVSARNLSTYRDPAIILIDQLKEVYIDGEHEPIDTTQWYPKLNRKDYIVGLNLTGNGLDDPDQNFYENYTCGAEGNYNGYCNPELDKLVDRQSMEPNQETRKKLVWEIERKLAEDEARPIIFHPRGAICRQPQVKGLTIMVNSIYNGWRMEDVWLEKKIGTGGAESRRREPVYRTRKSERGRSGAVKAAGAVFRSVPLRLKYGNFPRCLVAREPNKRASDDATAGYCSPRH